MPSRAGASPVIVASCQQDSARRGDDRRRRRDRSRLTSESGSAMGEHVIEPKGPFSLASARDFAGGFAAGIGGGAASATSLVMAFPVEPATSAGGAWAHSAVAELRQPE